MNKYRWIEHALIALLLLVLLALVGRSEAAEADYVIEWCERHGGRVEVINDDRTRVDCVTYYHAIEFDYAEKWTEAITQALHYAIQTGMQPGVVLILRDPSDVRYVERAANVIARYSLPIYLEVISQ